MNRSPINALDQIKAPLLTLQGADDKIVMPSQSQIVMDAVRNKGLASAYIEFPDEGHGFRRRETIKRTLDATLSFYSQIFVFLPGYEIDHVKIEGTGGLRPFSNLL